MKTILLLLSLAFSGWATAEQDSRLAALQAAYNLMQSEQQSVYQQFLMAEELRRSELQEWSVAMPRTYPAVGTDTYRQLNFEENTRLQRDRLERLQRYDRDISQAYARFIELGERKKALLDQILELSKPPQ